MCLWGLLIANCVRLARCVAVNVRVEHAADDTGTKHVIVDKNEGYSYVVEKIIGNGSFGVVFKAADRVTGNVVAIKKVLQDRRYKVHISITCVRMAGVTPCVWRPSRTASSKL